MAKRRANNEGTLYKRPNGKWRAQITIDGQRLSYTGDTQNECQAWIKDTRNHIDKGLTFKGTEVHLENSLSDWLQSVSASKSKRTHEHYRWIVAKRINPLLGNYKLSDLKPDRVQRYYGQLKQQGLSKHAIHCTHKVLRVSLNHAVKMGLIGRNPCKGTTPPKPEQQEMKFLDENQVKVLLEAAQSIGDRLYPLYYLAIHTGLRQAELMGLKWQDVDWERKTLQVKRQVLHHKGGGHTFSEPKSHSGKRTVVLGNKAIDVISTQLLELQKVRSEAGENWEDFDLVFPSIIGTPLTGSNIRRAFRKVLAASGLPKIRFHDLRHTAASLMLNHGIPVLIASCRLGHSKPSITLDVYGHLIPHKQEEAAHLLDSLVS